MIDLRITLDRALIISLQVRGILMHARNVSSSQERSSAIVSQHVGYGEVSVNRKLCDANHAIESYHPDQFHR